MTSILRLWHESDALFDAPDYEAALAARLKTDRHANGGLGLWCTYMTNPEKYNPQERQLFGKHLYMLVAHADPSEIRQMQLSELQFLSNAIADDADKARQKRQQMIDAGIKVLSLVENAGELQAIILDYSTIRLCRRVERQEL